jgi:carboxypeptidase C (cathepsin A)
VIGKDQGGAGTPKDVYGVDADAQSFAQFITRYITINNRWNSPKFLFGESYGTTRSAVLSNILENDDNVGLNGVILLSAILDYDISVDFPQINPGACRAMRPPLGITTSCHSNRPIWMRF